MESIRKYNLDYVYFILILVLSTWEYFFRASLLSNLLLVSSIIPVILFIPINYALCRKIFFLVSPFCVIMILHALYYPHYKITTILTNPLVLIGCVCIGLLIRKRYLDIIVNVITFISMYSLFIYLLCLLNDSIYNYLYNVLAQSFTSLNVEQAVQVGGGVNILVYNFQNDYIIPFLGIMRNCGPFWEPGMFAVFINIAIFIDRKSVV